MEENDKVTELEAEIERLHVALRSISQLLSYGVNTARHTNAKQIADAAVKSPSHSMTDEEAIAFARELVANMGTFAIECGSKYCSFLNRATGLKFILKPIYGDEARDGSVTSFFITEASHKDRG